MPQAQVSPKTMGGTAIESSQWSTWVALGLLAGVAGLVFYLRDSEKTPVPSPSYDEMTEPQPEAPTTLVAAPSEVGYTGAPLELTPAQARSAALSTLRAGLQEQRLWSTVRSDQGVDSRVVIVSASCEEPGLKTELAEAASVLKEAGFETAQCLAKHGALIFEDML